MVPALLAALALSASPAVGETAPDFTARDVDGKELKLSELAAEHTVLLVFFPKAFTPG